MHDEDPGSVPRIMIATPRKRRGTTVVVRDRLPRLSSGEIRLSVDGVGLSTNNVFYASMGDAPFLKFFSVYPVPGHGALANVPAWGVGTVIASAHPDFRVGERFRGFLHMTNVVQMRARRTPTGFVAVGGARDALVEAYNTFLGIDGAQSSPFAGTSDEAALAISSAPSALSGYLLYELLRSESFYGGTRLTLTSASSKLSLALAVQLQEERRAGTLTRLLGYTSSRHASFVTSTGLFDEVLTYERRLEAGTRPEDVLVDVAGDAELYRRNAHTLVKALAVGGTHSSAASSTFTAFGPSALLKLAAGMSGSKALSSWAARRLRPKLEMFFAPTVMRDLARRLGQPELDARCDRALTRFVEAALGGGWITVRRCDDAPSTQAAYRRIFDGSLSPSEAVFVRLQA